MLRCHNVNMTPAQAAVIAAHVLAAVSAVTGVEARIIRGARDDAMAPQAEIPATALRRVWLWALSDAIPTKTLAATAAGVGRQSVRRARLAVDAWRDRDPEIFERTEAIAQLADGITRAVTCTGGLLESVTTAAVIDRQELERIKREERERRPAETEQGRRLRRLAKEARAAGAVQRAEYLEGLARPRLRIVPRSRDLHRGRVTARSL